VTIHPLFLLIYVLIMYNTLLYTYNEELKHVYFSSNNIRDIKSRMKWTGYVACMRMKNACKLLAGKPEGRRPSGDLGTNGSH
jgi:hypothetical protein